MPNFSHNELNSIRELVSSHLTMASKLSTYANQCQDSNIKQMFSQASQQSKQSAQNLIQML